MRELDIIHHMSKVSATKWLDIVPDAILITDINGRIVYANRVCYELLGWPPDELEGEIIERLVPERFTDHASMRQHFVFEPSRRTMGAGLDLTVQHHSGREIPVDISLNPISMDGAPHVVIALRDISAHYAVSERLRLLSVAVDSAASGVVITDRNGIINWVNPAVCDMTGYSVDELIGQRTSILKSGHHDENFYANLWGIITAGHTWQGSIINRRKDGSEYHEYQTIAPVRNRNNEITHFIAIKQDVTERVLAEQRLRETRDELARHIIEIESLQEQLREQAIRDPLSNLFNRRYLDETLPRELAKASRDGTHLCMAMIDIDNFKRINDLYGHAVGDAVLVKLGDILTSQSRVGDIACRYGGEEFAVMLLSATLEDGARIAEGWRQSFSSTTLRAGSALVYCTISAGVAEWDRHESSAELLARADAALYTAKDAGRNHVVKATSN